MQRGVGRSARIGRVDDRRSLSGDRPHCVRIGAGVQYASQHLDTANRRHRLVACRRPHRVRRMQPAVGVLGASFEQMVEHRRPAKDGHVVQRRVAKRIQHLELWRPVLATRLAQPCAIVREEHINGGDVTHADGHVHRSRAGRVGLRRISAAAEQKVDHVGPFEHEACAPEDALALHKLKLRTRLQQRCLDVSAAIEQLGGEVGAIRQHREPQRREARRLAVVHRREAHARHPLVVRLMRRTNISGARLTATEPCEQAAAARMHHAEPEQVALDVGLCRAPLHHRLHHAPQLGLVAVVSEVALADQVV
eukprot:1702926-Prymnesium_polylepis.1